MPPIQPGDLPVRRSRRMDVFAEGVGTLCWGGLLFWFAWVAADPANQFGSWLAPVNSVPVPLRVTALVVIAGFLATQGMLAVARSFRPVVAVMGRESVAFPTLFAWRRVPWKNINRVSLKGRYMTFEMLGHGGRRRDPEIIDLSAAACVKEAVVQLVASVRPDLLPGEPPRHALDPFRQERDFGHHIWP